MRQIKHHKDYKPKSDCNGCGTGWNKNLVPDTIYGMWIGDICCIHDDDYERGGAEEDKEIADDRFLTNLLAKINLNEDWYYPQFLARHRAATYYDMVVRAGDDAFNYIKESEDESDMYN